MRLAFGIVVRYALWIWGVFFFQAEDGIRDLVRSRGLGDVYKRQALLGRFINSAAVLALRCIWANSFSRQSAMPWPSVCLLYTSDAADERSSVDLGGRRIIKKTNNRDNVTNRLTNKNIA